MGTKKGRSKMIGNRQEIMEEIDDVALFHVEKENWNPTPERAQGRQRRRRRFLFGLLIFLKQS